MSGVHYPPASADAPVGVFDSGVGGLSIVKELARLLPGERVFYFADTLHMPYGPRPLEEIRHFSFSIAENMLRLPVKAVIVACNTASGAALKALRQTHPGRIFIGMEPAVKPAAAESRSRRVGVLATQATFHGELFENLMRRFARDVEVICQPCPGLAEFIESHDPGHAALADVIEGYVRPLVERGIDHLVLGCTHYPLVKETIARVAGPGVRIVDPSPAIARRCRFVLDEAGLLRESGEGGIVLTTSGDRDSFAAFAGIHLGSEARLEEAPFIWPPQGPEDLTDIRR